MDVNDGPLGLGHPKLGPVLKPRIANHAVHGDFDRQLPDQGFADARSAPGDDPHHGSHGDSPGERQGRIGGASQLKTGSRGFDEISRGETEGMVEDAGKVETIRSSDEVHVKEKKRANENVDRMAEVWRFDEDSGKGMEGWMFGDADSMDKSDSVNEDIRKLSGFRSSDDVKLYESREGKPFQEVDQRSKIQNSNEEDAIEEERSSGKVEFIDCQATIPRSNEELAKKSEGIPEDVDNKRTRSHSSADVAVETIKHVSMLLQRAKALQMAGSALSSRLRIEEENLRLQAISLEKDIDRIKSDVFSALEMGKISFELAEKLEEEIGRAHWMLYQTDVRLLLSHKLTGAFLRLFLGPVNVKALGDDVRFKVKEEYNAYRDRTAVLFLAFPLILWLLKYWVWNDCLPSVPVQAYQAWLLFFYTSLAFRENILRINGSHIRPWWIYHHYCAMLMAVISLTWDFKGQHPHCKDKQHGVQHFLLWAMMQGVVMLLQNHYQRQRLYTRIALGKAGRMDVVWGETAGNDGQILLLYPLLFALQIFQGFIGYLLLRTALMKRSEWQVSGCGILFLVMAFGNFVNTMDTLLAKMRIKSRTKSKLAFAKKSL